VTLQKTYKKKYDSTAAESLANATFHANLAMINANNQAFDQGNVTVQMGINQFTDMVLKTKCIFS
jgi:hypothetical protein